MILIMILLIMNWWLTHTEIVEVYPITAELSRTEQLSNHLMKERVIKSNINVVFIALKHQK